MIKAKINFELLSSQVLALLQSLMWAVSMRKSRWGSVRRVVVNQLIKQLCDV